MNPCACGLNPRLVTDISGGGVRYFVECSGCGAEGPSRTFKHTAMDDWNSGWREGDGLR